MASFMLHLHCINGASWQEVEVKPETTIQEVKLTLEDRLRECVGGGLFYATKLVAGEHVLDEGTLEEAGLDQDCSVQYVKERRPDRAIAQIIQVIERGDDQLLTRINQEKLFLPPTLAEVLQILHVISPALVFLTEQEDLSLELCRSFMKTFKKMIVMDEGACPLICAVLGSTCGRACASPLFFLEELLEDVYEEDRIGFPFALGAVVHMYSKHDTAPGSKSVLCEALVDHIGYIFRTLSEYWVEPNFVQDYGSQTEVILRSSMLPVFDFVGQHLTQESFDEALRDVLPHDGGLAGLTEFLQNHDDLHEELGALEAALEQMQQRKVQGDSHDSQGALASEEVHVPVVSPSGGDESEETEDWSYEEVLQQSEHEAFQLEQAQLHEAIMRSKTTSDPSVPVVLLQFSQTKAWFRDVLLHGSHLQEERDALAEAGFSPVLDSGAKIFVKPDTYEAVAQHFDESWELKTSHVIVAMGLKDKVLNAVNKALAQASKQERGTAKVKYQEQLDIPLGRIAPSQAAMPPDETPDYVVKHTFVHVPTSGSMRSSFHPATI
eukprot:TRINITY_DN92172_c0_g1_i1.p1 TRINITY_DN92172_c0_g1~~TRINITY_DN92172_c0_g1_i1.p1  ORF type:complete len:551 (-),score=103.83 TRINITY_DN92172_c0_g1_i1:100-1752(-)